MIERGDTVVASKVEGLPYSNAICRVVLVKDEQVLLSHELPVDEEQAAERKAKGLPRIDSRMVFAVAPLAHCVRQ